MTRLCRALGAEDPALGLFELGRRIGGPRALRDLGMPHEGIDRATELALANPYCESASSGAGSHSSSHLGRLERLSPWRGRQREGRVIKGCTTTGRKHL